MLLLNQESCFWMDVCAWQGVGHGVDVWDQLPGGSDLRYWQPFCVYREVPTCLIYLERGHEEQANSDVEKQSANMPLFVR